VTSQRANNGALKPTGIFKVRVGRGDSLVKRIGYTVCLSFASSFARAAVQVIGRGISDVHINTFLDLQLRAAVDSNRML
jgi:hypothetical protein